MNRFDTTLTGLSALQGADARVLRHILTSMTNDVAALRNELDALRVTVASLGKRGEK